MYRDSLSCYDFEQDLSLLRTAFGSLPTKESLVLFQPMVPRSQKPLKGMALSLQSTYYVPVYAIWSDEQDDSRCQSANDGASEAFKRGISWRIGFRARRAKYWEDDQREKLIGIRHEWDWKNRICGPLGIDSL